MIKWIENFIRERREYKLRVLATKQEHEADMRVCHACETLKTQLEFQNLLIRELSTPTSATQESESKVFEPIRPKHVPWSVTRAKLERADKELASNLKRAREQEITEDNLDEELEELNAKSS